MKRGCQLRVLVGWGPRSGEGTATAAEFGRFPGPVFCCLSGLKIDNFVSSSL